MFQAISELFSAKRDLMDARDRMLTLERETQTLRLELENKEKSIKTLTADIDRNERLEKAKIEQIIRAEMETLAQELAAPISQLLTQEYLTLQDGNEVLATDVLRVSKQIVKCLERFGLEVVGAPGSEAGFDHTRHEALASAGSVNDGELVIIRMAGISYKGHVLRRAQVSR